MAENDQNAEKLHLMLLEGHIEEFNQLRQKGEQCDLRGRDLQGIDLRGLYAAGLDLRDCCLKQTDMRDIDLSDTNLEGASINGARIAGALFPTQLSAEEITLSLLHGTRMRYT